MNARFVWRLVSRSVGTSVGLLRWSGGTVWLGLRAIASVGRVLARLDALLAQTLPCPRGHAVHAFGVFECACGARVEGWAFGRCSVCRQPAGWVPCDVCGLPVRNPLWW